MSTSWYKKLFYILVLLTIIGADKVICQGNDKFSFSFKNKSLEEVLSIISEKAKINFVYDQDLVKNRIINLTVNDKNLDFILRKILHSQRLQIGYKNNGLYTLEDRKNISYDLSGYVVDAQTKEPLAYANVAIKNTDHNVITDKNGYFSLVELKKCRPTVVIQYVGYSEKSIFVNCLDTKLIKVELDKSPFIIDDVEIVDSQSDMGGASNSSNLFAISPMNYENLPVFTSPDLFRSLQALPGISSNADGKVDISIRGGLPSQNLLTLDGLQLYHLNHFYGFFSSISSTNIKDIRIYKGGYPAKYGSKISSVIDMSSKNGSLTKGRFDVNISQLNIDLSAELPLSERLTFVLSARRILFPGQLESLYKTLLENKIDSDSYIGKIQYTHKPEIFFADAFAKITMLLSKKDILTGSFLYTEDNNKIYFDNHWYYYDYYGNLKTTPINNNSERTFWGNRGVSFNWFRNWNSRLKSSFTFSTSRYLSEYTYREIRPRDNTRSYEFSQTNDLRHVFLNYELSYYNSKLLNFDLGIVYNNDRIKYTSVQYNRDAAYKNIDETPAHLALYLQNKFNLFDYVNLNTGVRFTHDYLTKQSFYEPRLSLLINASSNWKFKSSYGKYNQFIVRNVDENYHLYGNVNWIAADEKNANISSSEHFNIGTKYEDKDFSIEFEYFNKSRKNVFPFQSFRNVFVDNILINDASSTSRGFELQLMKKLGSLTGWISFTKSDSEMTSLIDSVMQKYPASNDVPSALKVMVQYNFPSWHFALNFNYSRGKPYTIPVIVEVNDDYVILDFPEKINSTRMNDMFRVDISFVKKFDLEWVKGKLGFSIYNLLNTRNVVSRYYFYKYTKMSRSDRLGFEFTPSLFVNLSF